MENLCHFIYIESQLEVKSPIYWLNYLKLNMKEQSTFEVDYGNDTLLDYLDDYGGSIKGDSQNLWFLNGRFKTTSGHIFANYMNISHKTEVQTVILRC